MIFRPPVPEPLHPLGWPRPAGNLEFRVTQGFYDVNPDFPVQHRALDLGNSRLGSPIYAPAPGRVLAEGWLKEPWSESSTRFGTGNYGGIMVVIDHLNGWYSALAHMADTIVNAGQTILPNQLLGHLGDTGSAQGAGHVHWDLYKGRPTAAMTYAQRVALKVDPWPLLEQNASLPNTSTTSQEELMRFGGSEVKYHDQLRWRVSGDLGGNFRRGRTLDAAVIKLFPEGTAFTALPFTLDGEPTAGSDQWLPALIYVDAAYQLGYFHVSVVEPVPQPAVDTAAIEQAARAAALAGLNTRLNAWAAARPKE